MGNEQEGPDGDQTPLSSQPGASRLDEFHLEEFKTIRAKLEEHIKDMRQTELFSLAGFSGLLAWLTSQKPSPHFAVWFLPALIPFMLFLRNQAHKSRINALGAYIHDLEDYFLQPASVKDRKILPGFEHDFKASGRGTSFRVYNLVFYIVMFAVAVFAPFVLR